jgi:hypothetical protein
MIIKRHELRDRLSGILSKLMYSETSAKADKLESEPEKEELIIDSPSTTSDLSVSDSPVDLKNVQ